MKKIIFKIFAVTTIFLLVSCEKDNKEPVMNLSKIIPPALVKPANGSDLILKEENANETVVFEWTATGYDINDLPKTTYILQADTAGGNFNNPFEIVSTTELSYSTTVSDFNNKLKSFGLVPQVSEEVQFRIFSFLVQENEDTWAHSAINTVTAEIYEPTVLSPDTLWVPGDYQGWNPAAAPNVYSIENNGVYTGWVYFPPGGTFEFKFTSAPDWNHTNFGNGGDFNLDTDGGAPNLVLPGEGNYYLMCDTINLVWEYELQNFALIGSFNDWNGDEPLTWDNENQWWTVTKDFEAGTEFKWRANGDWAVNFGDAPAHDGTLVQGGDNIVIENAGTYTINLILSEAVPRYEIIPQ